MNPRSLWLRFLLAAFLAVAFSSQAQAQTTSASTTDADGNTTTITKQPDGSTLRTVTGPDGQVIDQGTVTPEPVTHAAPKQTGTSASTTDTNGNTTTITKNPDGTTTRTVTDASGQVVETGPLAPEPVTKVPPKRPETSASTRNSDGTSTTITKNADGTTTRTVTDANGNVIYSEPVTPEPVTKVETKNDQLLYNSTKKGDLTASAAMALNMKDNQTLLEVSVLTTGKGTSFRTWVPERVLLILGKDKLKPVAGKAYYIEKETIATGMVPLMFAAIAMQYLARAHDVEASPGTPCPVTGKTEGESRERGKWERAIDDAGTVAGLSLLAKQAKGQVEGRRVTFDVSGRENELLTANLLVHARNADTTQLQITHEAKEADIKIPLGFKAEKRELQILVKPAIIRDVQ